MAFRVEIFSPAPPEAVLAALRENTREWRESAVPPGLRRRQVFRVASRIERDGRFILFYPTFNEHAQEVELRGAVRPAPGGGSRVAATCGLMYGCPVWLVIVAGVLAWAIFSGMGTFLVVLLLVAVAALATWNTDRRIGPATPEARYLVERLEEAVEAAGGAESP